MSPTEPRSLSPHYPTYHNACQFLLQMEQVPYGLFRKMYDDIWSQRGNPQENVDWADPDEWIPERLTGLEKELAHKIWTGSKRTLNPRYLRGSWYFSQRHQLITQNASGLLQISERGKFFLNQPAGQVVMETDEYEGTLLVLKLIVESGPGKRSTFLPEFAQFCQQQTTYRSENVIKGALSDRLFNLMERGYVSRRGAVYEATKAGLSYLEQYRGLLHKNGDVEQVTSLERQAMDLRETARQQLGEYLAKMKPYTFEKLIKFLLEEMGYTDVTVTSQVNDKGVDVIANIELGISSVREVVQVKRHKGNIGRGVLDQLRGSLHRFNAVRGTIITTGGFALGTKKAAFEPGAAPITLIDGDKLLDLLFEYKIGVKTKEVKYYIFDQAVFEQLDVEQDLSENPLSED